MKNSPRRNPWLRLAMATVFSPLALVPILVLYMIAILSWSGAAASDVVVTGLGSGLVYAGFGITFGLLGSVFVILPGTLLLRRLGCANPWTMAALGLICGLVPGWIEGDVLSVTMYAASGLGVALAFALIAGPALRRA